MKNDDNRINKYLNEELTNSNFWDDPLGELIDKEEWETYIDYINSNYNVWNYKNTYNETKKFIVFLKKEIKRLEKEIKELKG